MDTQGDSDQQARRSNALGEARRRGLKVPDGEVVELTRAWDDLTYRLSTTFGFRFGWTADQIASGALAALSNPAQNVSLARSELSSYRPLIDQSYAIHSSETPGTE